RSYSARELESTGLFDEVVAEGTVEAAVRRARALAERGAPFPRVRDFVFATESLNARLEARRSTFVARHWLQPAYSATLHAVAAAALPFDEGLQREQEIFQALASTDAAHALLYQARAQREAAQLPKELAASPREIRSIAVVGAGAMGTGFAIAALNAGMSVSL